MGKMKSVGNKEFANAKSLKQHVREVLADWLGEPVDPDDPDWGFLMDLLSRHEDWESKSAGGVLELLPIRDRHGNLGLNIRRPQGEIDISWVHCCQQVFRREPRTELAHHREHVLSAMRRAVEPQITAFRQSARRRDGTWVCDESGEVMRRARQVHVDHARIPFIELAEKYAAPRGGWIGVQVVDAELEEGWYLAESDLEPWREFHQKWAVLRILSARENLTLAGQVRASRRRSALGDLDPMAAGIVGHESDGSPIFGWGND